MIDLLLGFAIILLSGVACTAAVQGFWNVWARDEYEEGR